MLSILSLLTTFFLVSNSGIFFIGVLGVPLGTYQFRDENQILDRQSENHDFFVHEQVPIGRTENEKLGAITSENRMCSGFGGDMLRMGGNTADAIVATTFCVGVTSLYHSGIGGGGFMLIRSPNGEKEFIDFREAAPAAACQDMFDGNVLGSVFGGLASAVPGELRGLEYLHKTYGKLPWKTVMEPAIRTAREGWLLQEDLAAFIDSWIQFISWDFITHDPSWATDFAPNGTKLGVGELITRKRYANTLEQIANKGVNAFYTGEIAKDIIAAVQSNNGTMTMEDLAEYKIAKRKPLEIDYRGYKVTSGSAPSSGPVMLSVLKIIHLFKDLFKRDTEELSTHRMDEAIRFGYGMRTKLGDPDQVPGLDKYVHDMISDSWAEKIKSNISDTRTQDVIVYDPDRLTQPESHGTSHLSAIDSSGLAISMTTTVNLIFGSLVMTPHTGIVMNNEMNDFSIPHVKNEFGFVPSEANYIRPRKRPLSSTCPTIVELPIHLESDSPFSPSAQARQPVLITGAAGGSRIPTATLASIVNTLDRNMSVAATLSAPRMHDQLMPNRLEVERGFDERVVAGMAARGHKILWVPIAPTSAQAIGIRIDQEDDRVVYEAVGEPRQWNSGGVVV